MNYYDDAAVRTESGTGAVRRQSHHRQGVELFRQMRRRFSGCTPGEKDVNWLVDRVIAFLDATNRPIQRRLLTEMISADQAKKRIERQFLLSRIAADKATHQPGVIGFRKDVLKDRLLAPEQVETWINQQAKLDGPATHWLGDLPLPSKHQFEFDSKSCTLVIRPELKISRLECSASLQFLNYAALPDLWIRKVPTAATGVLERLRHLSKDLIGSYDWEEAAGTIFVFNRDAYHSSNHSHSSSPGTREPSSAAL